MPFTHHPPHNHNTKSDASKTYTDSLWKNTLGGQKEEEKESARRNEMKNLSSESEETCLAKSSQAQLNREECPWDGVWHMVNVTLLNCRFEVGTVAVFKLEMAMLSFRQNSTELNWTQRCPWKCLSAVRHTPDKKGEEVELVDLIWNDHDSLDGWRYQ